ncbi:MAG: hypothetical protein R3F48_13585 [Candidatus Zixiibacteriota bacterium]
MIKGFDRKGDYACLSVYPGFVYWLLEDFYINLLAPSPSVPFRLVVAQVAEIISNYMDIRVAARNLFTAIALAQYNDRLSRGITIYPSIKDIYDALRTRRYPLQSHLSRYKETLTNRLEGILSVFGDHICSTRALDWERFMQTDWTISLEGIPTDYQNLFITIMIAKIVSYRMAQNVRSPHLRDLLVFDEASTVFKKWHEFQEGTYLIADYFAKCREFGIGFIIGTQGLSHLADSVLANTATKILVGGFGLGSDYTIFGSSTGMTSEQIEFIKRRTLPGQACAKDLRYPFPFTLETPHVAQ